MPYTSYHTRVQSTQMAVDQWLSLRSLQPVLGSTISTSLHTSKASMRLKQYATRCEHLPVHTWYTPTVQNIYLLKLSTTPLPWTSTWLHVPPFHRGEEGRLIGYRSPYLTTPRVLLEGNRLVHSINVTYDITSYTQPPVMDVLITAETVNDPSIEFSHPHASAPLGQHQPVQIDNELCQGSPSSNSPSQPHHFDDPVVQISPMVALTPPVGSPEMYEWDAGDSPPWTAHAGSPQPRPRPGYIFLTEVAKLERSSADIDMYDQKFEKILLTLRAPEKGKPDVGAHLRAA